MAKQDYIPRPDLDYLAWHDQFETALGSVGAGLGVTPAEITEIGDDNADLHTKGTASNAASAAAKQATADFRSTRIPSEKRVRNLAQRVKRHPGYTEAIGQQLGIIGPEDSTDLNNAKPTLTGRVLGNSEVEIAFNKSVSSGVSIYGQRGAETGWTWLARDTQSPYVDNRPLLVATQPENRRYRARYLVGDDEVGLWSDDLSVTAA